MSSEDFDTTLGADRGATEPAMIVDVEGFEGPLDLRNKPSIPVRGFHMNGGWQLNYPYGFRTWKEKDWKQVGEIAGNDCWRGAREEEDGRRQGEYHDENARERIH